MNNSSSSSQPALLENLFQAGDLIVDLANGTVTIKGESKELAAIEYSLLRLFVLNAGRVLTHRQIFRELWLDQRNKDVGYISVHLTNLRSKLAPLSIAPEPGIGYCLNI